MVESSERPVLVVEDDPKVRALLAETLKGDGYAVEAFESALGLFPEMKRLRPCAVVLDLGLPYRSGLRLLTELKDDPATAAVPVIIVSGLVDHLSPERAALATAVLSKPFQPAVLLATLRTALSAGSCQPE